MPKPEVVAFESEPEGPVGTSWTYLEALSAKLRSLMSGTSWTAEAVFQFSFFDYDARGVLL